MELSEKFIEPLFDRIEAYGTTTIEISKLKALETSITVANSLVSKLSVIVMIMLSILVFNIGIALYLGELLGRLYYGFFIVATFYLVAGIISHFFLDNWIRKPLSEFIISKALN